MSDHLLFTYGTLLRDVPSPMSRWLARYSDLLGEGRLKGRLYDLGQYPGLVLADEAEEWVWGQVLRLRQAADVLRELDRYEGVDIVPAEYERRLVTVRLGADSLLCWTYVYLLPTDQLPVIPHNDYRAYYLGRPGHSEFVERGR